MTKLNPRLFTKFQKFLQVKKFIALRTGKNSGFTGSNGIPIFYVIMLFL